MSNRTVESLKSSIVPFFPLIYRENGNLYQERDTISFLRFQEGTLKIGPFTVKQPDFRDDSVAWSQTSDRGFTSGHLYFAQGGTELRGIIAIGDDAARAEIQEVVATAIPLGEYVIQVNGSSGAESPLPTLRLGFPRQEDFAARTNVVLGDTDLSDYSTWSLDETGQPVLDIVLPAAEGRRAAVARLVFSVTRLGEVSLSGLVVFLGQDDAAASLRITGIPRPDSVAEQAHLSVASPLLYLDTTLPDLSAALAEEEKILDSDVLGLAELLSCVTDDKELGDLTFFAIIENMKWAMSRHTAREDFRSRKMWLSAFFQETPPSIDDPDRLALIENDRDWFVDTMSVAVLGNNLAQFKSFPEKVIPRPLTESQKTTLKSYLQSCLPTQEAYLRQQKAMWTYVFRRKSRSLFRYSQADALIKDRIAKGEQVKTWAQRLLEYQTSETSLRKLADTLSGGEAEQSFRARKSSAEEERQEALAALEAAAEEAKQQPGDPDVEKVLDFAQSLLKAAERLDAAIEREWRDAVDGRIAHIKNVANVLAVLDPEGTLVETYMQTCGGVLLANTAGLADVEKIEGFQKTLSALLENFFTDIASDKLTLFQGALDEEVRNEVKDFLNKQVNGAADLASRMSSAMSASRNGYFLEQARAGEASFAEAYPGWTRLYRVGLAFSYALTVAAVAGKLWSVANSDEPQDNWTFDRVMSYASFIKFAVESFRSLPANFFVKKAADEGPGLLSKIGSFLNSVGAAIARSAQKLVAAASDNIVVKYIGEFFRTIISGLYKTVAAVGGMISDGLGKAYGAIRDWMTNSAFCKQVAVLAGKVWAVASQVLLLFSVIWSSYKEGLNLYKAWTSDRPNLERALTTIQFVCVTGSGIASILAVAYGSAIWSGVGAILAVAGVLTALFIAWKFPPESPLQLVITHVLTPFADSVAREVEQAAEKLKTVPSAA